MGSGRRRTIEAGRKRFQIEKLSFSYLGEAWKCGTPILFRSKGKVETFFRFQCEQVNVHYANERSVDPTAEFRPSGCYNASYGRGTGLGRGLSVGVTLGARVGVGVTVAGTVAVGVGLGGVGVAVFVAVAVGVGAGKQKISIELSGVTPSLA